MWFYKMQGFLTDQYGWKKPAFTKTIIHRFCIVQASSEPLFYTTVGHSGVETTMPASER